MQCTALRTNFDVIIEPPHKPNFVTTAACHGMEFGFTTSPPIILSSLGTTPHPSVGGRPRGAFGYGVVGVVGVV